MNLIFARPALYTLFVTLGSSLASPLSALQIHEYEAARHNRFETGTFPENSVASDGLWAGEFDFSGVGWSADDPRKGFALISPRHFVGANHFRPSTGSEIVFFAPDGTVRTYTYSKFYNIKNDEGENTDLFIGELAEDIPTADGISFYPVLDQPESELTGQHLVVYGRGNDEPRIGRGEIDSFGDSFSSNPITEAPLNDTRHYNFKYAENSAARDDAYVEVGDSGSPSFIVFEGALTVSGIHSALQDDSIVVEDRFTSIDSFILHYKDQIDQHLANTGHSLTLAPLADENPDGDDLKITAIAIENDTVTLTVRNSREELYDVQRAPDLGGDSWETVATGQSGENWSGLVPADSPRYFWRLGR